MANLVVTSTSTEVEVFFNDYSSIINIVKGTWNISYIQSVLLRTTEVNITIEGNSEWQLSFDGSAGTFQIDSVNSVVPISNSHLYDLLKAII